MGLHKHTKQVRGKLLFIILFLILFLVVSCRQEKIIEEPDMLNETNETIEEPEPEITAPVVQEIEDVIAVKQEQEQPVEFKVTDLSYERNTLIGFSFYIKNNLPKKIRPYIVIYALDEESPEEARTQEQIKKIDIDDPITSGQKFEAENWKIKASVDEINQEIVFKLMYVDLQKGKTVLAEQMILIDAQEEILQGRHASRN